MKTNKAMIGVVWFLSIALLWEAVSAGLIYLWHDPMAGSKLPYLHQILYYMITHGSFLFSESMVTLYNAFVGFAIGACVGIILAVLMSLSGIIEKMTFPYLILSQMIPVLGLAPIIYGIVHDADTSRMIIAGYITFFPVSINVLGALKSVEKQERDLLYCYAVKKPVVYQKLMFPCALPQLFAGLKIAAPLSITAAILVELMGAPHGIGVLILRNLYYGASQATAFWGAVFASALLGIVSYSFISILEWICVPWQRASKKEAAA